MYGLWGALIDAKIDSYFNRPYQAFPGPIYGITTRPGFIFDDAFWDVFHALPLHVCHVTALVNAKENHDLVRVFDLRFKPVAEEEE